MPIQKGTWLTYVSCIYAGLYQHIHQCRSPATKANVRIKLYVRRPFHPSLSQLSRASKGKHDEPKCKHEDVSCHDSEHYCSGGDVPPGNRACRCNELWSGQKGALEASIRMDDTQVKFWTKLCKEGQPTEAVKALDLLVHRGSHVDNSVFYGIIQKCMAQKDLALGRRVHALAVISGYESNPFVANHIICMYSSHGKLQEAMRVFGQVEVPNRYMWASIILAHARHGDSREAVRLYRLVRKSTLRPNNRIFVAALKACATAKDLSCGRDVHADILDSQGEPDMFVHNCLVDMYAKCGRLEDARKVFDVMLNKDVVTWTAMIAAYVQHGFGKEALTLYSDMQKKCPTPVNHVTVACLVQACGLIGATYEGKQLHSMVQDRGLEVDTVLGSSFISMYAKCGDLENARSVFDNLRSKDVKTWNAMITGYVQNARAQEAFVLYFRMQSLESCSPDSVTFVSLLQACGHLGGLEQGKMVHHAILYSRVQLTDLFVANALIEMYSKCGSLEDACGVFDSLATKDLAIWTAMISAYTQQGFGHKAINLYTEMQHQGINATDAVVFVCLLQACASARALHWGKKLHAEICERGLETDEDVSNCLVNMYAKCGSLEDAHHLFDHLERKSIGTYNGLIAGYVQYGFRQEALAVYGQMQQGSAMSADANTFVCILQACGSLGFENEAKQIHAQIRQRGLESDIMVGNSLVHMYAKIGSITDARRVFDCLPHRDVVTWNTLISGYTQHGLSYEALLLYENMTQEGLVPGNNVTFACLLQACASIGAVDQGKNLHLVIQQVGLGADAAVANSLVNMYAKCGYLEDAYVVFQNIPTKTVLTWNVLIAGCVQHGLGHEAIALYRSMEHEGLTLGDAFTFACLLQACASTGALQQGEQIHRQIQERGLEADVVIGNCLIDMYVKCGRLEEAREVFDNVLTKDTITWNTIIAGYAQHGRCLEGFMLFKDMRCNGATPANAVTFVCLLQACGTITGLDMVKKLHAEFLVARLEGNDLLVCNALIDVYGKCGSMADAQQVFDTVATRDVVTWTALIAGYARHGESDVVFDLFQQMKEDGIQPNDVTSLSVLTACNHAGLVDRAQRFFDALGKDYGIHPTLEHYKCMVDLLGRAGLVDQAMELVNEMPVQPDGEMWHSLLAACQKWNNLETATYVFECAMRLDQNDAAALVLMSNIYAASQRPDEAGEMQAVRIKAQAWKKPGQTWWTDGGITHSFSVGDTRHPLTQHVYAHLVSLDSQIGDNS